ncbi:hypothetical protein Kpol_1036p76 [Vanderwaltozyma polyspora DSM 70294]|uniref:ENTH domain-containing protein n=1 Tax=Vanderwaltozyma polyspora (strain ATCC 22028 / DSM 70294 / BCRC 21397 / CBS 2163 / NBRC 10782 / NRRL Y-8283 / UCD 57-17) TaxID=436907 RepID=A7TEM3_VANPO|nr:uncharacterized protein Kpol_1036p76 [Vanderwaltozyma polyspora DSM 70294]EDO19330.1 hypothetical protein Kpol_1036p76 [Vanderwaltozyma polyspora DSM 70294]
MDSLSKKIQNLGLHDFRNAARFAQNMIVQYEPYQIDIRTATNTDSWGPTSKHLQKVIRHKYHVPVYLMTEYILKRLIDHIASKPKNFYEKARKEYVNYGNEWRVVMKCLILIEFLLMNVSDGDELHQVLTCLKKHIHILSRETTTYRIPFSNDGKMEIHERGIHKKSELIVQLIEDPDFLNQQRSTHIKNTLKIRKQNEMDILNANQSATNSNVSVEDEESDDELQAQVSYEHRIHTSVNLDKQRKQRREILKERIKNNEEQRRKASQPVPDLLDFDDIPSPVTTSNSNDPTASSINPPQESDDDDDDDDEFGDFQVESSTTKTTPSPTQQVQETDITEPTKIQKNDQEPKQKVLDFNDLYQNSKSLI